MNRAAANRASRFTFMSMVLAMAMPDTAPADASALDATRALLSDGYYAAAESTARIQVTTARQAPGKDSLDLALAMDLLVESLWRLGRDKREETQQMAEAALRIKRAALGPDHPEVAVSVQNLGDVRFCSAKLQDARNAYRQALAIREKSLGSDHPLTAAVLAALARAVADSNSRAALPLLERSMAIRQKALPPEHPDVARGLALLAWGKRRVMDLEPAQELFERALAIQDKVLQPDHPDKAYTLYHYGYLLYATGDRRRALELDWKALAIREKSLGPEHPDVGWALNDIGLNAISIGQYSTARTVLPRAVAIFEKNPGSSPSSLGWARMNLASFYMFTGNYQEARKVFEKALAAEERMRGRDHHEVATVLNMYGQLLEGTGDLAGAKAMFERAISITGDVPRTSSLAHANLAVVYTELEEYDKADSLWAIALAQREKLMGPDSPVLVDLLSNYSGTRYARGDYRGAEELLERARKISDAHGSDLENLAYISWGLAAIEACFGNNAAAKAQLERADSLMSLSLGHDHPWVGSLRSSRAELLAEMGERSTALQMALATEKIGREHVELTVRTFSERQALEYAAVRCSGLDVALTLAAGGLDAKSRAAVWDAVIRARALVLDEIAGRNRKVAEIGRLARSLTEASEKLAFLTVRGTGDEDPETYQRMLEEARDEKEKAERELAESSTDYRHSQQAGKAGVAEVIAALPEKSALVAYVAFGKHEGRRVTPGTPRGELPPPEQLYARTPSYLAFVLRSGESEPIVVPIGRRDDVDSLIGTWSEEISRGARLPKSWVKESTYRPAGEALRRSIWDPVAKHLDGSARVFVVPDGALNLVSLATLPTGEASYLVESGPLLHVLTAERDLLRGETQGAAGTGLLAFGGPDFEGSSDGPVVKGARKRPGEEPLAAATPAYRGALASCGEFAALRWSPLQGTVPEVRNIASLWQKSQAIASAGSVPAAAFQAADAVILTGSEAGESAFKRLAPGRRVLHLATHGFFMTGRCRSALTGAGIKPRASQVRALAPAAGENPLLLSGLAMAGANRRPAGTSGRDDGVLTAEEVAALDLSGVEWAVLSACETGVGEVRGGEGVFGLRRAFHVAGVHTLVMSLWSVEDDATRRWMHELYDARFTGRLSTAEAVRQASLNALRERREKRENTHPFYWGAFVAAGDWR